MLPPVSILARYCSKVTNKENYENFSTEQHSWKTEKIRYKNTDVNNINPKLRFFRILWRVLYLPLTCNIRVCVICMYFYKSSLQAFWRVFHLLNSIKFMDMTFLIKIVNIKLKLLNIGVDSVCLTLSRRWVTHNWAPSLKTMVKFELGTRLIECHSSIMER